MRDWECFLERFGVGLWRIEDGFIDDPTFPVDGMAAGSQTGVVAPLMEAQLVPTSNRSLLSPSEADHVRPWFLSVSRRSLANRRGHPRRSTGSSSMNQPTSRGRWAPELSYTRGPALIAKDVLRWSSGG